MFMPASQRVSFVRRLLFAASLAAPVLLFHIFPLFHDGGARGEEAKVDFHREIRPLLVSHCYKCHSSVKQESNLRLDTADGIRKGGDSGPILESGNPSSSRLIRLVEGESDLRMPPEGPALSAPQIALLRRWIAEGPALDGVDGVARHWAFEPPQAVSWPTSGAASEVGWARGPLDAFVSAEHVRQGLRPVAEAPANILLRRIYLDLVGFPPSATELAEFLDDDRQDAFDRVVDRLLASRRYGERWGRHWMDVWRYSDWDGYAAEVRESQPHIWRWRDWIIESLNADKGYDRMIMEMLAGDEIAPDDQDVLRATGFLARNWYRFNRNVWLDATIEHTGKAFLGMTFNCARCHDHMYDPITQPEYYQLRAIFEPHDVRTDTIAGQPDVNKDGLARVYDANLSAVTVPFLRGDEQQPDKDHPVTAILPRLFGAAELHGREIEFGPRIYYPGSQPSAQEVTLRNAAIGVDSAAAGLQSAEAELRRQREGLAALNAPHGADNTAPTAPRSIVSDDFSELQMARWHAGKGHWVARDGRVVQTEPKPEVCGLTCQIVPPRDFLLKLRYRPTGGNLWKSTGVAFDVAGDADWNGVYASLYAGGPKVQVLLRRGGQDQYPDGSAVSPLAVDPHSSESNPVYELELAVRDQLLNVRLNGQLRIAYRLPSRPAQGKIMLWTYDAVTEFMSFQLSELPPEHALFESVGGAPTTLDEAGLAKSLRAAELACEAARLNLDAAELSLAATQARIAADRINYAVTCGPPKIDRELSIAATRAEREQAIAQAESAVAQAQLRLLRARQVAAPADEKSKKELADSVAALDQAAKAQIAAREALDKIDENYTRFGPVYPATSSGRRRALAEWITQPGNPLTARVAVNQIWLRHFGAPLVPTVFDFGMNGKPSLHPQLLDWLAVQLTGNDWKMKSVHRRIVGSSTYRMASTAGGNDRDQASRDPDNRYLWRMNARRMEAELVRDSTLATAEQLWFAESGPDIDPNQALTLPRRSIYFRTSKEKKVTFLALFDSANVVDCYRRSESVAPQQALAQANSSLTLAQARLLADNLRRQCGPLVEQDEEFIRAGFRQILGRTPSLAEESECAQFLHEQTLRLGDAAKLTRFASATETPVKPAEDAQQRARENLLHVLLNHHEFIMIR